VLKKRKEKNIALLLLIKSMNVNFFSTKIIICTIIILIFTELSKHFS